MLFRDEVHAVAVLACSQMFVDHVAVPEAQIRAAREELGVSALDVLQV